MGVGNTEHVRQLPGSQTFALRFLAAALFAAVCIIVVPEAYGAGEAVRWAGERKPGPFVAAVAFIVSVGLIRLLYLWAHRWCEDTLDGDASSQEEAADRRRLRLAERLGRWELFPVPWSLPARLRSMSAKEFCHREGRRVLALPLSAVAWTVFAGGVLLWPSATARDESAVGLLIFAGPLLALAALSSWVWHWPVRLR